MGILEIISTILKFALEIWRNRTDPELAKIRAAAQATKDLNETRNDFNEALKSNDGVAISKHFEQLRDRVSATAGDRSRNTRQSRDT